MLPADETDSPHAPSPKRRALWKRLLRFLLFAFLTVTFLLLASALILRLLYPPAKLRAMINTAAIEQIDRTLVMGDVWINPLRGIILEDVQLLPYPDSTAGYDLFVLRQLRVKRIELAYSLADLFDKQIHIHDIEIIEPEMELFVDMLDTTMVDFAALAQTDLPLSIDLRTFRLRNSKIKVILADTLTKQELFIGDLSGALSEVRLPAGGFARNDSALQLQMEIKSAESPLLVSHTDLHSGSALRLKGCMNLDIRLSIHSYHDIGLFQELGLRDLVVEEVQGDETKRTLFHPAFTLALAAHGDGHAGSMHLDSLTMALDQRKWLHAEADIDSLYGMPHLTVRLPFGEIPLAYTLDLARQILPAGSVPDLAWLDDGAALSFSGIELSGSLGSEIDYTIPIQLRRSGLMVNRDSLQIQGLGASFFLQGHLRQGEPERTRLDLRLTYDSLLVRLPDQNPLTAGAGTLQAEILLNQQMMPAKATATLQMDNLMGMQLAGKIDLFGGASMQTIRGSGSLQLSGIDFGRYPAVQIAGDAKAAMSLHIDTLDKIRAAVRFTTSPLTVIVAEEPVLLSDLNLNLDCLARTDTTFSSIRIDSLSFALNRMVEASARAQIRTGSTLEADFTLQRLAIRHDMIWAYLPEVLKEPFGEADLVGTTSLTARGRIAMAAEELFYDVDAQLQTASTSFTAPAQFTLVNGLGLMGQLNASCREGFRFDVEVALDSLKAGKTENVTIHHNKFSLKAASKDPAALIEAEGRLALPDLNTSGSFTAQIAEMNSAMRLQAQFDLQQSVDDTLRLPQGIKLRGNSDFRIRIEADTAVAQITARIATKDLSFFMPGNILIRDVNTDLQLRQGVDLVHKRLIGSPAYKIATPSSAFMDYMIYREFYEGRLPGFSHVQIGRIEVMDYAVEDIDLELWVGEGRLEIPAMKANIYGGNMGGRMELDLAEGDLQKASYEINAHFANINSDLLLPKNQRESRQGIINANLDLHGTGLDMMTGIKLEGQAYITRIGPKVADNLLRSLDPQGKDSSIRSTRLLINQGFKPKLMTFVLRHGYLYPEIIFDQPWYFPMRLSGGKVELARIPLEFFLRGSGPSTAGQ
jgi:hypothetical protein